MNSNKDRAAADRSRPPPVDSLAGPPLVPGPAGDGAPTVAVRRSVPLPGFGPPVPTPPVALSSPAPAAAAAPAAPAESAPPPPSPSSTASTAKTGPAKASAPAGTAAVAMAVAPAGTAAVATTAGAAKAVAPADTADPARTAALAEAAAPAEAAASTGSGSARAAGRRGFRFGLPALLRRRSARVVVPGAAGFALAVVPVVLFAGSAPVTPGGTAPASPPGKMAAELGVVEPGIPALAGSGTPAAPISPAGTAVGGAVPSSGSSGGGSGSAAPRPSGVRAPGVAPTSGQRGAGGAPVAPPPAAAPSTAAAGLDFDAITGRGCKQNSEQGFYTVGAGLAGWRTGTSGGFGGYGCTGRYDSMPLTGADRHTDSRYQVWWFQTSAISTGQCQVWVFIPAAADGADNASIAHFAVIPHKDSWDTIGTFQVDQSAMRGRWAGGGTYRMTSGKIAVKLLDRGYGRASGAAVLVKCRRS